MGQSHSDLAHLENAKFNPQYQVLQTLDEPHYGNVKYIRDVKTSEKMILKEMAFTSKQAFDAEASLFNKLMNLKHPNLIHVLGYNFQDTHNFCSSYYKISVFIENVDQNFLSDFNHRKSRANGYEDEEFLHIAESLISCLAYFQSQGFSHGDIRPINIFIKDGVYKLSDPSLNIQKGSNALTFAIVHGIKTLLAPELLQQVPKGRFDITSNPYKADVFSLGMTLLALATLKESEELYDMKKGVIDKNLLNQRLEKVRINFSEFTLHLLQNMLEFNPDSRPDFLELSKRFGSRQNHSSNTIDFKQAKQEGAKKSAHVNATPHQDVPTHNLSTIDELEKAIQAAIEKSEATFRTVTERRNNMPEVSTQGLNTPSQTYDYNASKSFEIGGSRGSEQVKSSAPQNSNVYGTDRSSNNLHPGSYTPTNTNTYSANIYEPSYTPSHYGTTGAGSNFYSADPHATSTTAGNGINYQYQNNASTIPSSYPYSTPALYPTIYGGSAETGLGNSAAPLGGYSDYKPQYL